MKLWIARNKGGMIALHYCKPQLYASCDWCSGRTMWLDSNQFPEVTFENSPQQVEIKLIKEE